MPESSCCRALLARRPPRCVTAHAVAPGAPHTQAKQKERPKSWGNNRSGQLGDGTHCDSSVPVRVDGATPSTGSRIQAAAAG
ncbi:RCC1-like domain-containing protein [Streptomyces sp. NPDC058412]|uniref:RCC1-like domain-containing protein n=1 Tax=Streptomyces sp. NPDC058412 TaxID=3346486 RepID=UPI00364FA832